MIKRMTLLVRKHDLSLAQFRTYWHEHHARIVERMPGVSGYVQNPVIECLTKGEGDARPFTFDGVVELWFADEAAKVAAFDSPAAKSLPDDELNFMRGITIFAVEETELRPGSGNARIMLLCRGGHADANAESAPGAFGHRAASLPGVRRAVANRVLSVDWRAHLWHEPRPPDLIVELGFESVLQARALTRSPAFVSLEADYRSSGGIIAGYLVEERRVI